MGNTAEKTRVYSEKKGKKEIEAFYFKKENEVRNCLRAGSSSVYYLGINISRLRRGRVGSLERMWRAFLELFFSEKEVFYLSGTIFLEDKGNLLTESELDGIINCLRNGPFPRKFLGPTGGDHFVSFEIDLNSN